MKRIILSIVVLLFSSTVAIAETHKFVAEPVTTQDVKDEPVKESLGLPVATADIVYIDDANNKLVSRIKDSGSVGVVSLPLVSTIDTYVKIRFSDENLSSRSKLDIHHLKAGRPYTLQYAAFQPTKGTLEILNENDEVIITVPYEVLNRKMINHSIGTNVNHRITPNGESDTRMGVGYRLQTKKTDIDDGTHSINVRVSTSGEFDEVQLNLNYNYNF